MIEENEFIMLILCLAILVRLLTNYERLQKIPHNTFLLLSFVAFFAATAATICEGYLLPDILNLTEHLFYLVSAVLLTFWLRSFFKHFEGGA
ncbi:hypothetical protein Dalk_1442 [Desulfatibacillum aliphaticivorans]|uniref:Uncharacterized protein n=1 Tax=Desulfatibacillum aliphaticivorans TaxID=218208 RepID=B8FA46_DESAL|nr:hypothetical protein Dalk_1442 [Desulfatibacillum aliphaticivorans]